MNKGHRLSRLFLPFRAGAVVATAGLVLSACAFGVGSPSGAGSNTPGSGSSEAQASGAPTSSASGTAATFPNATETLATWEGNVLDGKLRIDINEVLVSDGMTRLTFTVTNTGPTELDAKWKDAFKGDNTVAEFLDEGYPIFLRNGIRLVDPQAHQIYTVGRFGNDQLTGHCLCTDDTTIGALKSEQSLTLYTTFQALPEERDTINVDIAGTKHVFENVKVTRK